MRLAAALLPLLLGCCATVPQREPSPRVQVGLAFDANGEIASFAEGLADPQTGRAVALDDPVRVASVSKLVVAIAVMKLVEQRKLDLHGDVSRWLGRPLRNPSYPDEVITLSMLLSHTGSVREHDDNYAIPLGASLHDLLVNDRGNWDSRHGPADRYFSYANLNYGIIGSIIERVTGTRFDIWTRNNVLVPMGLDACFNWSACSDAAVARAVQLDSSEGEPLRDDLHGRRPACPVYVLDGESCDLARWKLGENGALFSPQGGLRVSARGLAQIGRMLLGSGTLDGTRILSPTSVDTLLAQVWRFNGSNGFSDGGFYCSAGHGSFQIPNRAPGCGDDMGTRGATFVGHAGDAYGLKAGLWVDRDRRRGIAYFVTGVPDNARRDQSSAFTAAEANAFRRTFALFPR